MKQASPEPAEMLFGRLGGAVVPDYQAASKVTHLSCWNQDLPTSAAGFTQTRLSAGVKRKLPGLQTEQIILLVFSNGSQDPSFCLSFLSAEKNFDA